MNLEQASNSHLSVEIRSVIEFKLKSGVKPKEIIESWECEIHKRNAPSLQTIYSIQRQIKKGDSVIPKKTGPKKKHVLTEEKLKEVEETIK